MQISKYFVCFCRIIIFINILFISFFVLFVIYITYRPIEKQLYNHFAINKPLLGSKLEDWNQILGNPEIINYGDDNKMFYWPNKGIIACPHPHYKGQFRKYNNINEWQVDSLIIPLQKVIFIRIAHNVNIGPFNFNDLISINIWGKNISDFTLNNFRAIYFFIFDITDKKYVGLSKLPLGNDIDICFDGKKPIYIKIYIQDSIFGDYD